MLRVQLKNEIDEIQNQEVVKDWTDGLSKNGKLNYLRALAEFSMVTQKTPKEMLTIAYDEAEKRIPPWELSIKEWFKEYEDHCIECNRSKATRDIRRGIIKSFFHSNDITTPKESTKRRNNKNKFKIKNQRPGLTKEVIKSALDSCRTLRLRAIILTQTSSGLSVADVVNLKLEDFQDGLIRIDEEKEICMFKLRRQKTDKRFITFISFEAVEAIKNYIKTERKPEYKDEHLFLNFFRDKKITEDMVQKDFRVLNNRMKNEQKESGAYRKITSHMFRKFFNTQLTNAGMTYEIRKHMMGHVLPNKVDDSYYLENSSELKDIYLTHIGRLTINPTKTLTIETDGYKSLKNENLKLKDEIEAKIEQDKLRDAEVESLKVIVSEMMKKMENRT